LDTEADLNLGKAPCKHLSLRWALNPEYLPNWCQVHFSVSLFPFEFSHILLHFILLKNPHRIKFNFL
jgi:hypothetical protein